MRRINLMGIMVGLVLILFLAACGGNSTPATGTESTPVAGTSTVKMVEYVGEIPDTEFFVAIAISPTGDLLAYVCDGMGVDYLFHGTVQSNALDATSDKGGASLKAQLQDDGYAGVFSADGKTYSFTTVPVKDYGGLYRVTGLTEFEAEGSSQGGATIKINLTPDKERVQVAVTTTDGSTLSYDRPWRIGHDHREPTEYSESWLIYLNDGRARGGHIKTSLQTSVKHIDPVCPP